MKARKLKIRVKPIYFGKHNGDIIWCLSKTSAKYIRLDRPENEQAWLNMFVANSRARLLRDDGWQEIYYEDISKIIDARRNYKVWEGFKVKKNVKKKL
jgi:hypothetical protein